MRDHHTAYDHSDIRRLSRLELGPERVRDHHLEAPTDPPGWVDRTPLAPRWWSREGWRDR